MVLRCCDNSYPAKPFNISEVWMSRVYEEYFAQGDEERYLKLPVSPLHDRYSTVRKTAQSGFIEFVVQPMFQALSDLVPEVRTVCMEHLTINKERWEHEDQNMAR